MTGFSLNTSIHGLLHIFAGATNDDARKARFYTAINTLPRPLTEHRRSNVHLPADPYPVPSDLPLGATQRNICSGAAHFRPPAPGLHYNCKQIAL